MSAPVRLGDRVMMRYRLPAGAARPMTDVLGILLSVDPVTVRTAREEIVSVEPSDVVNLMVVPRAPASTSAVRTVEHAAAQGFPGTEHAWAHGCFLRAGHGFTGRANSAVALGPDPVDLDGVRSWYAERELPAQLVITRGTRLPIGWQSGELTHVLIRPLDGLAAGGIDVRADLDDAWSGAYHYRGTAAPPAAAAVLRSVVGELGFGRIADDDGPVAIGRAAVTTDQRGGRWLGLSAVEVAPHARRRGLAGRLCAGLATWGAERGAETAYLQVADSNTTALALYEALGFTRHHTYRYARQSGQP